MDGELKFNWQIAKLTSKYSSDSQDWNPSIILYIRINSWRQGITLIKSNIYHIIISLFSCFEKKSCTVSMFFFSYRLSKKENFILSKHRRNDYTHTQFNKKNFNANTLICLLFQYIRKKTQFNSTKMKLKLTPVRKQWNWFYFETTKKLEMHLARNWCSVCVCFWSHSHSGFFLLRQAYSFIRFFSFSFTLSLAFTQSISLFFGVLFI